MYLKLFKNVHILNFKRSMELKKILIHRDTKIKLVKKTSPCIEPQKIVFQGKEK